MDHHTPSVTARDQQTGIVQHQKKKKKKATPHTKESLAVIRTGYIRAEGVPPPGVLSKGAGLVSVKTSFRRRLLARLRLNRVEGALNKSGKRRQNGDWSVRHRQTRGPPGASHHYDVLFVG